MPESSTEWFDLSDDELRERLLNRGVSDGGARLLVRNRDCDDCAERITRELG